MRYRIYSETRGLSSFDHRETADAAVPPANYLTDPGAAGVEIWDDQMPDRVSFQGSLNTRARPAEPYSVRPGQSDDQHDAQPERPIF
jgi:hypothetical protein